MKPSRHKSILIIIVFRCSLKVFQYYLKDRDFEQNLAHACDHAHVTLQWRSCACKLDRAIHLDLLIIVHYRGLLRCSPVVNADWIGSVLGALVR